jgi:GNAT superfamily N-acetyltransferase
MSQDISIIKLPAEAVLPIRHQVMYAGYPVALARVEGDENANHWGLHADGKLVSVISLFESSRYGGSLQFRKFATLEDCQGKGYGSRLMKAVIEYAKSKQYARIWCNARLSALSWYQRFGFEQEGDAWQKNGIDYIIISKLID